MKNRVNEKDLPNRIKNTKRRLEEFHQIQPPKIYLGEEHTELFSVDPGDQETVQVLMETRNSEKWVGMPSWDLFFQQQDTDEYKYPDGSSVPVNVNNFHVLWFWDYITGDNLRNNMAFHLVCVNNTGGTLPEDMRLVVRFSSIGLEAPGII